MSTSPRAPQAAGACHWTASQVEGPHTGKGSLLTSVETLVSISRAPVFLWTIEGVSPQPEIQEWGTCGAARYRQRNCSCKRQKQWRWQHECKLHSCLLCFFWKSSLPMFQYHAKKSPNNIPSNHWIYVLREERRKTHEWSWYMEILLWRPWLRKSSNHKPFVGGCEREYSRYPFARFSTEHLLWASLEERILKEMDLWYDPEGSFLWCS